jgi:hypothetical protein
MLSTGKVIDIDAETGRRIRALTEVSHAKHMDLLTALDWSRGFDLGNAPKRDDACWIAGTPAYAALDLEQRRRLAWVETARDVSMFIWLEQTLPPLYIGYINTQGHLLPDCLKEYLLVFSKEEIVHVQVFRRCMAMTGLPAFGPPEGLHELFVEQLPRMSPVMGMLATMLVEWVAEQTAQHAVEAPGVDPLTRQMFLNHHVEELRHISFAKWVIAALLEGLSEPEHAGLRRFTETLFDRVVRQSTVNAEIVDHVDFDLGFGRDDPAGVDAARRSPNNRRINGVRYGPVLAWLRKTGLVGDHFQLDVMDPVGGSGAHG